MPFITVNGANIYYETFGEKRPGQTPVVLIHGSTGTGRSNWEHVAPLLAREYYVIVPDCRGHGQSSNPKQSYSFKELAADTAGLIRQLGYLRAHIIGHSNGGNVVLVTLLEHPDVVQTCIPMAANAWVSPDLVEKEPPIFDPERVRREAPKWMEEMIALHGPTHGMEYWRDLLRLTVAEIIAEPNYTAEQLAQVQRPVLVIQGAQDRVNAPYKHGQFIARHIPYAERWIPEATGHSVHEEHLLEWVERVLDFLNRRGDEANEALHRLKQNHYRDSRGGPFDLRIEQGVLSGAVLEESMLQAAHNALPQPPQSETVKVLLTPESPWALVNRAVDDLRRQPSLLAERISQARLGEVARVLEQGDRWSLVRLEHDGYIGWIHSNSLHLCTKNEALAWQQSCTHQVLVDLALACLPEAPEMPCGRIAFATRLPVIKQELGSCLVRLPAGQEWWLDSADLAPIPATPQTAPEQIGAAIELLRPFVGIPYMWGGRSPYGYDCSGLAGTFWAFLGLTLLRDADQQFQALPEASEPLQPGDLLFFGSLDEDDPSPRLAHITHVAISLGGQEFIHANGTHWGIGYNSFNESRSDYAPWLKETYRGARRPR